MEKHKQKLYVVNVHGVKRPFFAPTKQIAWMVVQTMHRKSKVGELWKVRSNMKKK